ncbi:hypothetical protein ACVWYH_009508 [Bradyrhizobium sp. GM24.11]
MLISVGGSPSETRIHHRLTRSCKQRLYRRPDLIWTLAPKVLSAIVLAIFLHSWLTRVPHFVNRIIYGLS